MNIKTNEISLILLTDKTSPMSGSEDPHRLWHSHQLLKPDPVDWGLDPPTPAQAPWQDLQFFELDLWEEPVPHFAIDDQLYSQIANTWRKVRINFHKNSMLCCFYTSTLKWSDHTRGINWKNYINLLAFSWKIEIEIHYTYSSTTERKNNFKIARGGRKYRSHDFKEQH